ncbi:VacJ family lipoprotein [Acinetobacter sp. ANC 4648]|uniref:MlaA family lipoprotein n=1 Tax=Acinetobacter sp. ANC 4648 TaxID=1977875 RepID=UPI000A356F7E|nr:VacJ family lipoprotein [Acinetobacter sp. ANC 4648]OTG84649.1 hypothetical protein B9T27_00005 [Acinetobacter sp. ANC 4648]
MHRLNILWATLLTLGLTSQVSAQDALPSEDSSVQTADNTLLNNQSLESAKHPRLEALKELKNIKRVDLKVDANAAQSDQMKDPLQPLNREIFQFNDKLDQYVARPLAVQYKEKVPEDVRSSYTLFRKNLSEPWNAANQLAQGRPVRALKSVGRFTINTITSLGMADPARRLGLSTEEESLGTTLGYYGIPSGPYLMLPILGPSTLRNSLDYVAEGYANPLWQIRSARDQTGLIWGNRIMGGINARSRLLDFESALQGDKYAAIRDIYLQRLSYSIAQKKGLDAAAISFLEDDSETDSTP